MKILIFNTLYYPNQIGGAEKSVQLLAEGLAKNGQEVIIVTTSNRDYIDYINGVKVYYIKTGNLYWPYISKEQNKLKKPLWHIVDAYNIFNTKKIEKIIKNENPDVVHTNNLAGFSVIVWKIAKKYNKHVIHTLRDYYLLCPKSTMFNEKNLKNCENQCFRCKYYSIPKKKVSEQVDAVIGISKFVLNKHFELGYFPNTKIKEVIYNPVMLKSIQNLKLNIGKNNTKKTDIILGFVGRIEKAKGIEFLLENFLKLRLENVKLYIYGKGTTAKYEREIRKKYTNDKIFFKGFKNSEEIYNEIDILIVPSLWNEPFGRIVLEANSYGIPVLVSNRGGLLELINNGKNGYVFNPNKLNDFKEKLVKIINDYRLLKFNSELIKNYSVEKFSVEIIVKQYIKMYYDMSLFSFNKVIQ